MHFRPGRFTGKFIRFAPPQKWSRKDPAVSESPREAAAARFLFISAGENTDGGALLRPGRFGDSRKSDYLAPESQTPRRVSDI